jgi:ribosomal protein S18 acetylase RimI-like enzyme
VTEAPLPEGWYLRRPTLDDVSAILEVVHASDVAAVGYPDFSANEVVEILTMPDHDPALDSWLAYDASGRLGAWAYIVNPSGGVREVFDVYVHPDFGTRVRPVLLGEVLARIGARATARGLACVTARAGAIASETAYVDALTAAGFTFTKRYARMRIDFDASPPPAPAVVPGVTIRSVRREDEAELRRFHDVRQTAFRDTPDFQDYDFATWQERLAALPSIAWDEWFVAEAGGELVGLLQSSDQQLDDNEGWVKNLAVRKEFRGRGIGAALLATAFGVYLSKGRRAAGLAVDMTNPTGAYRLYRGVGMSPSYEADLYEKTVAAAP